MKSGLYTPGDFKDNCGFGLMAHTTGDMSHELLTSSIDALTCMTHRGGIAADGKTGDGCGLLIKMPDTFMRSIMEEKGIELPEQYSVGSLFMSLDNEIFAIQKKTLEKFCQEQELDVITWRTVPTNNECLGPMAIDCIPRFEQVFISSKNELSDEDFAIKLFYARRLTEKKLSNNEEFYVASFNQHTLSYKGLMMPADIAKFYLDLADKRLETAICVFHQRFSTNTMPRWPLAQPFRLLAHNGEINTIQGNRNWANARRNKFKTDRLPNIDSIQPIVNTTGSDSSSMDNMLELLVSGGMGLFRALRMMIPPAWQNVENICPDLRAFHEYNSMHMEAWDGPAGIVVTDGRYAVCGLDRNGLRPSRWVKTKNGFMTVASEVGVNEYKPEDVIAKGRVGPGEILAIDTLTGNILTSDEIDDQLKTRHPYKKWIKENAIRLESKLKLETMKIAPNLDKETLNIHQKMHIVSNEERNQTLRPIAELGQEATGSMGDDSPMAVLSQKVRNVSDYFRQQFAQVTNPPIDPLREAIVMSLETCLGIEKNVFVEAPDHAKAIILTSPVLSPKKYHGLKNTQKLGFKSEILTLSFSPQTGLKQAILDLRDRAAQKIRDGATIIILSDRHLSNDQWLIPAVMATGAVHHYLVAEGLRCDANIVVETGSARDAHQFAVLFGFGATAVYPWLTYEILD
jgi:glutamate synthase (NADPH/NADH) large chain